MSACRRYLVFTMIGALGFFVQSVTLVALVKGAGLHYLIALAIAVEVAVLHNFLWHEQLTWRDRPVSGRGERLVRLASFHMTNGLISILGNLAVVSVLVEVLRAPLVLASVAGMITTGLVNFVASDRLVFATPRRLLALAPARILRGLFAASILLSLGTGAEAADLRPETVEAWNRYVRATEARIARDEAAPYRLLASHDAARILTDLHEGEVIVEKLETLDAGGEIDVPGGLVHHWRGTVFLRGVTLEQLLVATRSPELTARLQPDVLALRVLERDGERLRLYIKVERKSVITVTYNTEYLVHGRRWSPHTATSRSLATKIAEIADAGTPLEREKPIGQDRGFLWRLNAYWRYEQVEGGVIAELESITLSRTVPLGLETLVRPIIDREARRSINTTLVAFRGRMAAPTPAELP